MNDSSTVLGSTVLRIEVPEEISRVFKAYCALNGRTMPELLTELLMDAIAKDGRIQWPESLS